MTNTSSSKQNGRTPTHTPDPEVVPRAARRQFSAAYKRRIVAEAEASTKSGEIGELLRREGLYSSHLTNWRRELAAGTLGGKRRGRPAEPLAAENAQLRQENERLRRELEKTQLIIDAQKKLAEVLGLMNENEVKRSDSA